MRFRPRKSAQGRRRDACRWHDWFAWYPIYVDNDDIRGYVWWETVRRHRSHSYGGSWWEYELRD